MPNAINTAAVALTVLVSALPLSAQTPIHADVIRGDLADTIHHDLSARAARGFSGAVIVALDGEVVLKAGYGWANQARRVPFTTATIAQVGSLTKQFTAAAVVDLALRGRLAFDDPLATHLAGVPPGAARITLHQLLTHTAGLPSDCGGDFERVTREDLVSRCLAGPGPDAPAPFAYSNLGYSLLAAVVERVGGKTLEDYLADRFFVPLGMTRTGYFFPDSLRDRMATSDGPDGSRPNMSERLRALAPAYWNLKGNGGMQASADDMYAWFRALSGDGTVVPPAMREALTTPHVRRDDAVAYGYGWFVRADADGTVRQVSHTGSDGVFFAAFVWRPADRFFYYMVTSSGERPGAEVASQMLRTFRDRESHAR